MKYPIGLQSFEGLRNDGYVYVDKTHHVYKLANEGKYYFLSRPRRFGKSLLLSTMEAYFQGKKELFQGLALEQLETEWAEYPILHLDLNTGNFNSQDGLSKVLEEALYEWEKLYGSSPAEQTFGLRFKGVIRRVYEKTGKQVVVLIDEYDKPMLQAITDDDLQEYYRNELRAFYSVLKGQDQYIRFAFLTGVTKFGQLSVFSGLNNLKDITMDHRFVDICGITEKEILTNFDTTVNELAEANNLTREATLQKLKEEYDGYHFEYDTVGIYNPFSLLNTFDSKRFRHYWFATGTPTFLVEVLKRTEYDISQLQDAEVDSGLIGAVESFKVNPIPVIYQSGYLTIKEYDDRFGLYRLGFPNKEVEKGFIDYLAPYYTPIPHKQTASFVGNFIKDVERGNANGFMEGLQTLFAGNDYRVAGDKELYFQNAIYIIFKLMGFYTEVEHAICNGRIDVLIKTSDYIYVIELKLDGSADEALQQIEDKGYALPFIQDPRRLFKIGVDFDSNTRGIKEWEIR